MIQSPGQTVRDDNAVRFHLPSTYAIGVAASAARTRVAGEFARTDFSHAFQPVVRTPGLDRCATPLLYCPGWGIANYEAADASTWRAGVEQTIPAGRRRVIARAGLAFQDGYSVARPTSDPFRNGGSAPAPPFLSTEEPPRERSVLVAAGLAYAWEGGELAFGFGRTDRQTRLLADVRIHLP